MASSIRTIYPLLMGVFAGCLILPTAGCGESDPKSTLPPQQADAVSKLEAVNAKVAIRDGKVTYVDFYGVPDVATVMVEVKSFPDLVKLNFSSTNLSDDELVHLADMRELRELALNRTQITDNGLVHVAGLAKLETLNLNEDNVTDAGLVHLQNLKNLKQLHLNQTKISDAGFQHLAGLEQLEWLLAYGTSVTPEGAAAFRESHPATQVVTTEGESGADGRQDND